MSGSDANEINGRNILLAPGSSVPNIAKPVAMHQYEITDACGNCGVKATRIVVIEMSASSPGVGTYCQQCADGFSEHGAQGWSDVHR